MYGRGEILEDTSIGAMVLLLHVYSGHFCLLKPTKYSNYLCPSVSAVLIKMVVIRPLIYEDGSLQTLLFQINIPRLTSSLL